MASEARNTVASVFIDSSVFIAAAISARGSARDLLMRSVRGEVLTILSSHVLEETERNLSRKAPLALPAFYLLVELLPGEVIQPRTLLVKKVAKVVEVKDAVIVAGAITAQASFLATYDRKHLLDHRQQIREHFNVVVATPDEILSRIGNK